MGLPDGRKSFKIGLVVLIQYRLPAVTDSQPDRQTRCRIGNTRYAYRCIAPKNLVILFCN